MAFLSLLSYGSTVNSTGCGGVGGDGVGVTSVGGGGVGDGVGGVSSRSHTISE